MRAKARIEIQDPTEANVAVLMYALTRRLRRETLDPMLAKDVVDRAPPNRAVARTLTEEPNRT
jgi:hypothetical protein